MEIHLYLLRCTGTGSSAWHFNMAAVCKEQAKAVAEEVMKQLLQPRGKMPCKGMQLLQMVLLSVYRNVHLYS